MNASNEISTTWKLVAGMLEQYYSVAFLILLGNRFTLYKAPPLITQREFLATGGTLFHFGRGVRDKRKGGREP